MSDAQTNGGVEERRKALAKLKRPELDAEASGVGVEQPEEIGNAEEVVEAILSKEAEAAKVAAEAAAAEEAAAAARTPSFNREELLEHARGITGYRRHLVAGALTLADEDTESFTKAEATALVKRYLKRKDDTREAVS